MIEWERYYRIINDWSATSNWPICNSLEVLMTKGENFMSSLFIVCHIKITDSTWPYDLHLFKW